MALSIHKLSEDVRRQVKKHRELMRKRKVTRRVMGQMRGGRRCRCSASRRRDEGRKGWRPGGGAGRLSPGRLISRPPLGVVDFSAAGAPGGTGAGRVTEG